MDAAGRRLAQLGSFASLGAVDATSGLSVEENEVDGVTVTTVRWTPPPEMMLPVPVGVVVEYALTEDRALIGVGEGFVQRVLELEEADSLASAPRYVDAVAELGGAENAGVTWLDLAGTREAVEMALGPMIESGDPDGVYETEILPWLAPLDRFVTVSRIEGDVLVARAALTLE
jgi:hypothetical protein